MEDKIVTLLFLIGVLAFGFSYAGSRIAEWLAHWATGKSRNESN
jgi:hypothetical protein